jgi:hypothetical protein
MKAVQLLTVLVLLSSSARAQLRPQRKTTKVKKGHKTTTPEMVEEQVASKAPSPKMMKKTKSSKTMDKQKHTDSARSKAAPTLTPTVKPMIKPTIKPTDRPTRKPVTTHPNPTPPSANCDPATDLECDDPEA